jgi:hypothetical protein
MEVQCIRINAKDSPDEVYTVEFAFIINPEIKKANRVYSIDVEAISVIDAISKANQVLHSEKVQSFLDFANNEGMSLEDVISSGALYSWMNSEPTSVQIFKPDDKELLFDLTAQAVNDNIANVSTEIEDFLRSQNDS